MFDRPGEGLRTFASTRVKDIGKRRDWEMPKGPDKYCSMTALYNDPLNIQGVTYGKRWRRHEWSQVTEEQVTDNPETKTIVMALHGGGIETGTSEIALASAGYHPATLVPSSDGYGLHDFWLFEGLLPSGNGDLHVTASHYDEPIAHELVRNARRCISLHGCTDAQAKCTDAQPKGKSLCEGGIGAPAFGVSKSAVAASCASLPYEGMDAAILKLDFCHPDRRST